MIQLLLTDVDGVLTDGSLVYGDGGELCKIFNAKDGVAVDLLRRYGVEVGVVSGRASKAVEHRCDDLRIDIVRLGVSNKLSVIREIAASRGLQAQDLAFVGDDIPDLPLSGAVGLFLAPLDAHSTVLACADVVLPVPGGRGVLRSAAEWILTRREGLTVDVLHRETSDRVKWTQ